MHVVYVLIKYIYVYVMVWSVCLTHLSWKITKCVELIQLLWFQFVSEFWKGIFLGANYIFSRHHWWPWHCWSKMLKRTTVFWNEIHSQFIIDFFPLLLFRARLRTHYILQYLQCVEIIEENYSIDLLAAITITAVVTTTNLSWFFVYTEWQPWKIAQ